VQCSAEKCRAQSRCEREGAEELRMRKERGFGSNTAFFLHCNQCCSLQFLLHLLLGGFRVLGLRVFFTYDQLWWMGFYIHLLGLVILGSLFFSSSYLSLSLSQLIPSGINFVICASFVLLDRLVSKHLRTQRSLNPHTAEAQRTFVALHLLLATLPKLFTSIKEWRRYGVFW
jgi:hypothetical protein